MYKRILVPLDGSPLGDRVLPYVRTLGKKLEAKVELFRVFDPQPEFFYPNPFQFLERHEASARYREEVMTALGTAKTHLERAGVAATGADGGGGTGRKAMSSARPLNTSSWNPRKSRTR